MNVKQKLFWVLILCVYVGINHPLKAQTCEDKDCGCVVNPAPAGIMISHLHEKNQWMVSYRYMHMEMSGMQQGTKPVSDADVFAKYLMTCNQMQMDMHMVMAMYGLSDRITLMAMAEYRTAKMQMGMLGAESGHHHAMQGGMNMNAENRGFGDTRLSLIYGLFRKQNQSLLLNGGLSIPTANLEKRGAQNEMYAGVYHPYAMQLGSGTWDFLPGITYTYRKGTVSGGTQMNAVIRMGTNSLNYKLGNELTFNQWLAWQWSRTFSASLRLEGYANGKIDGRIPSLDSSLEPSAHSNNYGGSGINGLIGLICFLPAGFFQNQKLGVEAGIPFYQNTNGIQMKNKYGLYASWSIQF